MPSLMPFDELNRLCEAMRKDYEHGRKIDTDELLDDILDLLVLAYTYGNTSANNDLGTDVEIDISSMKNTIYYTFPDGKNFEDRVREHIENDDIEAVVRVATTEMHRDFNESVIDSGKRSGKSNLRKTWVTMMDEKVRDTHDYLEGMTISIDQDFYTFDGDHAAGPGGFQNPENNINCRCEIKLSQA